MKKTKLAEEVKNLEFKEVFDRLQNILETRDSLAKEIIPKLIESEINNTIRNDELYRQLHGANKEIIRLINEKSEESRSLYKVIQRTHENICEIQMEVLKRIEAFEQLKEFKNRKYGEHENVNALDTLDFVIDEFQRLSQFIEYRLVPISTSQMTKSEPDATSNS